MGSTAVVTLGGKGSSLTSFSLHAIAYSLSLLRIDSSALDRLHSSSNQNPLPVTNYHLPKQLHSLSPPESRAFLAALLCKLLLLPSTSPLRSLLPVRISEALNSHSSSLDEALDVTEEERLVLESLSLPSFLCGICAVLDYRSTALSTIIDAVAALSCEASGADVAAFGSLDSGDGFTAKEDIGVAGDLKVLLNGSKLVGKTKIEEVLEIPKISGKLREVVKAVHSSTRIELNSSVRGGIGGTVKALATNVVALVAAINNLGESSLLRAKTNSNSSNCDGGLRGLFEKDCPSRDSLKSVYKAVWDAHFEEDYVEFGHQANVLLEIVWKIVTWEAVAAFVALEGRELLSEKVNVGMRKQIRRRRRRWFWGRGLGL